MKILWLDINSSYSHSSVALPAIHAQVQENQKWEWSVIRGTINDNPGSIATAVVEQKPDIIASSFWLFTHNMQIEVLSRAVQILNNVKVVCGGPEFSGDNEVFLRKHKFVTAVIRGEGEEALPEWLSVSDEESKWRTIKGLCWISPAEGVYMDNGTARVAEFSSLKYPEDSCFFSWDKPFVQLETTRGCFNTCAFCVSGGERPVRYQSLDQVRDRLQNIYSHGIIDVRVLDRTFNHDNDRACKMLDLFVEYAGKMRFHIEIHPSLLTDELKKKLSSLPEGLLHLEAGIQSLNSKVLAECNRKGSLKSSLEGLRFLCSLENIETHADLIAGLPSYTLDELTDDIYELMEYGVDELQIESLKVLPGTQMRLISENKGLKYSPLPPYEVLQTPDMSAPELREAMHISRMTDLYYNCKSWQHVIRKIVKADRKFIVDFTSYLKSRMVLDSPISMERRGVILFEYCKEHCSCMIDEVSIAWTCAGLSLKKEPAGNIIKIKDINKHIQEQRCKMSVICGEPLDTHRYYLLETSSNQVIFGYDSINHQPSPSFIATLNL